jgi:intracellular septation protein
MGALVELLPIILFFVAYKSLGMLAATGVAILAVMVQVGSRLARKKRVEPIMWITLGAVVVLGGATLASGDERFIKWKPSLVYWAGALGLVVSRVAFGKNLIRRAFENSFSPPERTWLWLLGAWVTFLAALGGLNLFVASRYSSDVWVNFKLFGATALLFTFLLLQFAALWRYRKE